MQINLESAIRSTLNDLLPQYGLSLPVQGSVTVAGAISTATHGSGRSIDFVDVEVLAIEHCRHMFD
jgi:hypothetical protein